MLHVAVVTGSRADYGPLRPLLRQLAADGGFRLSLVVCAVGAAAEADRQVAAVEDDGLSAARVIRSNHLDAPEPAVQAARALEGTSEALRGIAPDIVLLLGDRFEILAAALAAHLLRLPVVHLSGGDETLGSLDDAMRHAISQLASLHFPSNIESAGRLRALGVPEERIEVVGSTALDDLARFRPLPSEELAAAIGLPFELRDPVAVVTYHAATAAAEPPAATFNAIINAVRAAAPTAAIVVTPANADEGGAEINAAAAQRSAEDPRLALLPSLGPERYWSLLHRAALVIGNSSSALIEAPLIGVPVVDVGDRQASRLRAPSARHASADPSSIAEAVAEQLQHGKRPQASPYGDGSAVPRILNRLAAIEDPAALLVPIRLTPAPAPGPP